MFLIIFIFNKFLFFSDKKTYKRRKLYKCEKCGTTYTYLKALKIHQSNNCPVPKKIFHCEFCTGSFIFKHSLDKHVIFVHKMSSLPIKK